MVRNCRTLLILSSLLAAACTMPQPERLADCRYDERGAGAEFRFVLPSLREQSSGADEIYFYAAPASSAKLRFTSLTYARDYAGKRYRRLATITGSDGSYDQWLTEDCRLLYTPVGNGPQGAQP